MKIWVVGTWKTDQYKYITYDDFNEEYVNCRNVLAGLGVDKNDKV